MGSSWRLILNGHEKTFIAGLTLRQPGRKSSSMSSNISNKKDTEKRVKNETENKEK